MSTEIQYFFQNISKLSNFYLITKISLTSTLMIRRIHIIFGNIRKVKAEFNSILRKVRLSIDILFKYMPVFVTILAFLQLYLYPILFNHGWVQPINSPWYHHALGFRFILPLVYNCHFWPITELEWQPFLDMHREFHMLKYQPQVQVKHRTMWRLFSNSLWFLVVYFIMRTSKVSSCTSLFWTTQPVILFFLPSVTLFRRL